MIPRNSRCAVITNSVCSYTKKAAELSWKATKHVCSDLTTGPKFLNALISLVRENVLECGGAVFGSWMGRELGSRYHALVSRPLGRIIGCGITPFVVCIMVRKGRNFIGQASSWQSAAARVAVCGVLIFGTVRYLPDGLEELGELVGNVAAPWIADLGAGLLGGLFFIQMHGSQEELIPTRGKWYDSYAIKSLQCMVVCAADTALFPQSSTIIGLVRSQLLASLSYNAVDIYRATQTALEGRLMEDVLPSGFPRIVSEATTLSQSLQTTLADQTVLSVFSSRSLQTKYRLLSSVRQICLPKALLSDVRQIVDMAHQCYDSAFGVEIVALTVIKSSYLRKHREQILSIFFKDIPLSTLGPEVMGGTKALVMAVMKGSHLYLREMAASQQIRDREAEIYHFCYKQAKTTDPLQSAQLTERLVETQKRLVLQIPQHSSMGAESFRAYALMMRLACKDLAPDLAEIIMSSGDIWLKKIEKQIFGCHIRYQAGDRAFKIILEAHIPGIVIYSLCKLREQVEQQVHQVTLDQEKDFYNTTAQTLIRHYQRSTSVFAIPFWGLTSAVAEQIKTSRLR